jgi:hypothetical protein
MKHAMYEVIFEVTETLQNGNERRVKKGVFVPRFKYGKHISHEEQIARGEAALRDANYYNIVYVSTKATTMIFG